MSIFVPDDRLTPSQATDLLQWVIGETRDMLRKAVVDDFKMQSKEVTVSEYYKQFYPSNHYPAVTSDFEKATLAGFCGHAVTYISMMLQDIGYAPQKFLNKCIPNVERTPFGHGAVTLELQTTEGPKRYLLDPTFKQFCTGDENSPGVILSHLPGGEHVVGSLLEKGYVEFTPAIAYNYLAAFYKGICPLSSEQAAWDYITKPTYIESRLPVEKGCPPKGFFVEKGWIPKLPSI